jgi:hypothetical protein
MFRVPLKCSFNSFEHEKFKLIGMMQSNLERTKIEREHIEKVVHHAVSQKSLLL